MSRAVILFVAFFLPLNTLCSTSIAADHAARIQCMSAIAGIGGCTGVYVCMTVHPEALVSREHWRASLIRECSHRGVLLFLVEPVILNCVPRL